MLYQVIAFFKVQIAQSLPLKPSGNSYLCSYNIISLIKKSVDEIDNVTKYMSQEHGSIPLIKSFPSMVILTMSEDKMSQTKC